MSIKEEVLDLMMQVEEVFYTGKEQGTAYFAIYDDGSGNLSVEKSECGGYSLNHEVSWSNLEHAKAVLTTWLENVNKQ